MAQAGPFDDIASSGGVSVDLINAGPAPAQPVNNGPEAVTQLQEDPWISDTAGLIIGLENSAGAAARQSRLSGKTVSPDDVVSPTGAVGLFQVEPSTAAGMGFDPSRLHDRTYNRLAGTTYLQQLRDRYTDDSGNIDMAKVVVAYNAGPGHADNWDGDPSTLVDKKGRPLKETQAYLARAKAQRPDLFPAQVVAAGAPGAFDDIAAPAKAILKGAFDDIATAPAPQGMPNPLTAMVQGIVQSGKDVGRTFGAKPGEETSPAAQPLEWGDILHPETAASKIAYGLGHGAPMIAGGIAGSVAGGAVPGGGETGIPELAGGALGAGLGTVMQTLGPAYESELKKTPKDPDGAFDRALHTTELEGGSSSISWAAFGYGPFKSAVKNVLLQAFGVQPGIAVATKAAENKLQNRPLSEDLGESYASAVPGTLVPMVGHGLASIALSRLGLKTEAQTAAAEAQRSAPPQVVRREPTGPEPSPGPPEKPTSRIPPTTGIPEYADERPPPKSPESPEAKNVEKALEPLDLTDEIPPFGKRRVRPRWQSEPNIRQEGEDDITHAETQGIIDANKPKGGELPNDYFDDLVPPKGSSFNLVPRRDLAPEETPGGITINGRDVAITATGRHVPVQYALVEADHLIPSQTPNGQPNPLYPAELQPRDRTRIASQAQISDIAGNLDPQLLDKMPLASHGPPIISSDGVVESGNGRTLAIQHAYENVPERGQAYRQYLADRGYPVEGMQKPVLVRVRAQQMSPEERVAFSREANESGTAAMSATERAMADATALPDSALDLYAGGDVDLAKNRPFVRKFMETAVPKSEHGAMIDKDGAMSREAVRRVQGALLAKAYGDAKLVAAIIESPDANIQAIGGALTDVAAEWGRMRGAARAGEIPPEMDQTRALMDAVRIVRHARAEGRNIAEYVGQTDMLTGKALDESAEAFLRLMFRDTKKWTLPVGSDKLAEALGFYITEATKAGVGTDMLGNEPVAPPEILALARKRLEEQFATPAKEPGLFSPPGARPDVRPPGGEGAEGGTKSAAAGGGRKAAGARGGKRVKTPPAKENPYVKVRRETYEKYGLSETPDTKDRGAMSAFMDKAIAAAADATDPEERDILERAADWAHSHIESIDREARIGRQQPVHNAEFRVKGTKPDRMPNAAIHINVDPQTGTHHWEINYDVPGYLGGNGGGEAPTAAAAMDAARKELQRRVAYDPNLPDSARSKKSEETMDAIRDFAEKQRLPGGEGPPPQEGPTREETIESLAKKGYGDKNKFFTKSDAEKAREILRQKLRNGGDIAKDKSGALDPEVMHAGFTLAGYHIEAGAREFADFAREMLDELGEAARPYLRMWYNSVRDYPDFEAGGMTPAERITPEVVKRVSGSSTDLERDREEHAPPDEIRPTDVPPETGGAQQGARAGGAGARPEAGGEEESGGGVPDRGAATVGKPSDSELQGAKSAATGGEPTEPDGSLRGSSPGSAGIPPDRLGTNTVGRPAEDAGSTGVDANADIRRLLPELYPEQQDDVAYAAKRLEKEHGVLFTNGTGTGKTYTGAGVAKYFWSRGKQNIIVIAPSHGILSHWQEAMANLGMPFKILEHTGDNGGSGPVGTTYANFYQNRSLSDRDWDLQIADESHNLMSQADGEETKALAMFRALSKRPENLSALARMRLRQYADPVGEAWQRARALEKDNRRSEAAAMAERAATMERELAERMKPVVEALRKDARGKAVFLSATPFAYDKNVDYANGYLFDYGPEPRSGGYNQPSAKDSFFMRHFGYRMRYNKLTKPDSAVENEVMERQFHEFMRRSGALAGRVLNVDKDYDRKFVLVDDGVGHNIDKALDFLWKADEHKFGRLANAVNRRFDYLKRMRLLEAIKANHVVPLIQKNLDMGRKVVVFHDFNEGGGFSPFGWDDDLVARSGLPYAEAKALHDEFLDRNPYVHEINDAFTNLRSPIVTLTKAFPDAAVYNGTVLKNARERSRNEFNRDGSKTRLMVVQSAAGQAGISLHDTTGRHPRVLYNLGMPGRPVTAIQEEGRIYRIGQASDAAFRYMNTGTNWERYTFANRIAQRSGTAENLALGERARRLRDSFIEAFNDSGDYPPGPEDGKGGKEKDRREQGDITDFDRAKTYYFAQGKKTSRNKSREGIDYFATPEPIGLKMTQWADLKPGDSVLEPSAGHGAIARWFPETMARTLIEPSDELASRAALSSPGAKVLNERFEDLHAVNKYDAIVMNPPFGSGGKTAIDHIERAANHLKDGGRIVALIPEGPAANGRFEKFMESEAAKHLYVRAESRLPEVTFERAGTHVRSRIVVLDKIMDEKRLDTIGDAPHRDYSNAEKIGELFDRIQDAEMPSRSRPPQVEAKPEGPALPRRTGERPPQFDTAKTKHSKTGEDLYVASLGNRVSRQIYLDTLAIAKKHGGYYSAFKGSGAIPGFQFKTAEARQAFLNEMKPTQAQRRPRDQVVEPNKMFATEPGAVDAQGNALPQTIMPGMEGSQKERIAAELAKREGRGKLEARKAQKPADIGLFAPEPGTTGPDKGSQGTLFQRRGIGDNGGPPMRAPTFFSSLERGIDSLRMSRADPDQWRNTIANMGGVKKQEIEWSGLNEWLAQQKGPINRDQIREFLRENNVQIGENMRAEDAPRDFGRDAEIGPAMNDINDWMHTHGESTAFSHAILERAAEGDDQAIGRLEEAGVPGDMIRRLAKKENQARTKYAGWRMPGGEDYRELVFTLPPRETPEARAADERYKAQLARHDQYVLDHPGEDFHADPAFLQIIAERNAAYEARRRATSKAMFTTDHWNETNPFAHARFDTRRGPNGEKGAHLAEVQSDWHEKGRDVGYRVPQEQVDAAKAALKAMRPAIDEMLKRHGNLGFDSATEARMVMAKEPYSYEYDTGEDQALAGRWAETWKEAAARDNEGKVPNAPFKKNWHELVMKRMLRYAAAHGFHRLTWDTGERNADRYNLAHRVNEVSVWPASDGKFRVDAKDKSEKGHSFGTHKLEDLSDVIGKELATKVAEREKEKRPLSHEDRGRFHKLMGKNSDTERGLTPEETHEFRSLQKRDREVGEPHIFTGKDLAVGGEGMRFFYDRQLPQFINRYAKKWGAKAELSSIPQNIRKIEVGPQGWHTAPKWEIETPEGSKMQFGSEQEAQHEVDVWKKRYGPDALKTWQEPVWSVDITPAMRDSVLHEGQPLFQFGKRRIGGNVLSEKEQLAHDLIGHLVEHLSPAEQEIATKVQALADRIAPGATVRAFRKLEISEPGASAEFINGATYATGLSHAIAWALDAPDAEHTLRHEAFHWLGRAGLLTDSEQETLRQAAIAGNWIHKTGVGESYAHLPFESQLEEAIAEQFAAWRRGDIRVPKEVHPLFQRIREFLAQMADHLRRTFGQDATADDVFSRIASGEVGERAPGEVREANRTAAQRRRPAEPPRPESEIRGGFMRPINRMLGQGVNSVGHQLSQAIDKWVPDSVHDVFEAIKRGLAPMAAGSARARAQVKDFANALRRSRWEWNRVDQYIEKKYSPAERKLMWDAADEESVLRQQQYEPTAEQGLNRLTAEQRADVEELQGRANETFAMAKRMGMTKAEGLPSYVPRMVVLMTQRGVRAPGVRGEGRGSLRTTTAQLLHRKYLEVGETSEAAKAKLGETAEVVHDIRTLSLATARLQQAIAGRALIDRIKEAGKSVGQTTVHEGETNHPDDYFTMEHPAFRVWKPEFVKDDETGKIVPRRDEGGQIVYKSTPLYVSKEYEGPLRAVLDTHTGDVYNSLMALKGKMMSTIMYSPAMHNAVIWGKAIPAAPRKVLGFSVYFDGNKAKNDPATMREALSAGLDPIGRRYFNQDLSAIVETPQVAPGRSWTAQLLGYFPSLYSREAGDSVKRSIDMAGDVWHNRFLWDRVADLQMGLYTTIRDSGMKKGLDAQSAQRLAAHFANRYAGSLPIEAMSKMARQTANLALFSRSFTLGNAGAWKDSVMGLPRDVQAQILRDRGVQTLDKVQGEARRKAISMLIMDIALSRYGLVLAGLAAYGVRKMIYGQQASAYQPPSQNEPGYEQRFFNGFDKDGRALYGRMPTGKVGEELWDWVTEPRGLALRKLSPYGQIAYAVAANEKDRFGHKLFDPYSSTPAALQKDALNIGGKIADSIAPMGVIDGLYDLAAGKASSSAAVKTLMPMTGITVSSGFPGGPAQGEIYRAKQEHDYQVQQAMPSIRAQIKDGDVPGARKRMRDLGMPPGLINFYVRTTKNPSAKPSAREMQQFRRYGTPEQQERVQQDISQ